MTDESIVIEIKDGIDSAIANKLQAIEDRSKSAYKSLQDLQKGVNSLSSSSIKAFSDSLNTASSALDKIALSNQKLATEQQKTVTATNNAQAAQEKAMLAYINSEKALISLADLESKNAIINQRSTDSYKALTVALSAASDAQKEQARTAATAAQASINSLLGVQPKNSNVGDAKASAQVFVQAANDKIAATKALDVALSGAASAEAALNAEVANLRAAISPTAAAEEKFNNQIANYRKLLDDGRISTMEYNAAVKLSKDNLTAFASQNNKAGDAISHNRGLTAGFTRELIVLGHEASQGQFSRFGGSLLVLAEYSNTATKALGLLVGPVGIIIGAIAFIASAAVNADRQLAKLNNTITLTGNYAGVTAGSFSELNQVIANDLHKSISAVNEVSLQYLQTGDYTKEQIIDLTKVTFEYSRISGQTADDVAKSFSKISESPKAFAQELAKSTNIFTTSNLQTIASLQDTGKATEATDLVLHTLLDYLEKNAPSQLGTFDLAVKTTINYLSDLYTGFKNLFNPDSLEQQLTKAKAALANFQSGTSLSNLASKLGLSGTNEEELQSTVTGIEKLIKYQDELAKSQAALTKVQREGAKADAALDQFTNLVGTADRAKQEIDLLRDSITKALAANPNDQKALDLQAKQAQVEKAIREKYNRVDTKTGESRASALAKVNLELTNQATAMNMLGIERDKEQAFDKINQELQGKKVILTASETKSIKDQIAAIKEGVGAAAEYQRIYNELNDPTKQYSDTLKGVNKLLNEGKISQSFASAQIEIAKQKLEEAIDPLYSYNKGVADSTKLLNYYGDALKDQTQLQELVNQSIAKGQPLSLTNQATLLNEIALMRQKKDVQSEVNSIYDQSVGAQKKLQDQTTATNIAYQNGYITLDQYSVKLNQLAVSMANLKLQNGTGGFADGITASLGTLTQNFTTFAAGASQTFGTFFQGFSQGFADSVGKAIVYSDNLGQALQNVSQTVLSQLISSLIQLGIQAVLNATLGQSVAAASTATSLALSTGAATATAAAWAPAAALVSLASFGANQIPAIEALTTTVGVSQGLASLNILGFQSGGYTGNAGVSSVAGVVHGQEYVFDAKSTSAIGVDNLDALRQGKVINNSSKSGNSYSFHNSITVGAGVDKSQVEAAVRLGNEKLKAQLLQSKSRNGDFS